MVIDLSIPGAQAERAKLKVFHRVINHPAVIPEQAYRMAKRHYPLVCHVNNIVGPFLSKNYEVIPVSIVRAHDFMAQVPPVPTSIAYYELIGRYLRQVAHVLSSFSEISPEMLSRIPSEILNSGPQEEPDIPQHDT